MARSIVTEILDMDLIRLLLTKYDLVVSETENGEIQITYQNKQRNDPNV